jgi:hypothetical protein
MSCSAAYQTTDEFFKFSSFVSKETGVGFDGAADTCSATTSVAFNVSSIFA